MTVALPTYVRNGRFARCANWTRCSSVCRPARAARRRAVARSRRDHEPQLPRRASGGGEYVVRLPGEGTLAAGHRPHSRAAGERSSRPAGDRSGGPRRRGGMSRDRASSRAPRWRPASRPSGREELGRALRAFHDSGLQLPVSFAVGGLLEQYAAPCASGGASCPADYATARTLAARIAGRRRPLASRPCHDDLLAANIIRSRRWGPPDDRRLGVRGHGRPALRPWQPGRQQRLRRRRRGASAGAPTTAARRPTRSAPR